MFAKKQFNPITKQIISLQIIWLILSIIFFLLIAIFEKGFFFADEIDLVLVFMIFAILSNIFMILRNAAEIDKNQTLYIKLNFSII